MSEAAFREVLDKQAIRELVQLYSRAIDRRDYVLLRDLYTDDAIDSHGPEFEGGINEFIAMIEQAMPRYAWTGHHICNHMIAFDGDTADGEVYALAVRYLDNYRRCEDGKWRFSRRWVAFDMNVIRPFTGKGLLATSDVDPSYEVCGSRLFAREVRG